MKSVQLNDRLYGQVTLREPVLVDLLETQAVRRLEGVLQHGVTALLGITQRTSRLEHSIGVMLLVRRLGGGLQEQVAALLHDISHTAFSHVIDYVFNDHTHQSFHERMKAGFLEASDIPAVLARHGFDWRIFVEDADYPLLEQPAPALCADRLDYFLRDSLDLGLADRDQVNTVLQSLAVHRGQIVVSELPTARWLAQTFMAADEASWANFREVGLYELAARAIRRGLQTGALLQQDLWTGDDAAWERLKAGEDGELQYWLRLVSPDTQFEWDAGAPTFWVHTKLRTIDPPVHLKGETALLSAMDPVYAEMRTTYLARKAGPWPVRVVPV